MTTHRDFVPTDRLPAHYIDALQEYLSTYVSDNFAITQTSPTSIQVVAGTGNDQVAVGITGKMRYITSTISTGHPGGGAGTYKVWVTSHAPNDGVEDSGAFNYDFSLVILPSASSPSGTGEQAISRLIATLQWDGSAINTIAPLYGTPLTNVPRATQGNLASRPTNARIGDTYFATDDTTHGANGTEYLAISNGPGSTWVRVGQISVGGDLAGFLPSPTVVAGAITGPKINASVKPSGSATDSTESLRALGYAAGNAAPGAPVSEHMGSWMPVVERSGYASNNAGYVPAGVYVLGQGWASAAVNDPDYGGALLSQNMVNLPGICAPFFVDPNDYAVTGKVVRFKVRALRFGDVAYMTVGIAPLIGVISTFPSGVPTHRLSIGTSIASAATGLFTSYADSGPVALTAGFYVAYVLVLGNDETAQPAFQLLMRRV